jgi:hypothetical protein
MRTITHMIDTKAVKKVISTLQDHRVVRELNRFSPGFQYIERYHTANADGAVDLGLQFSPHTSRRRFEG